jgi:hypothetical protein
LGLSGTGEEDFVDEGFVFGECFVFGDAFVVAHRRIDLGLEVALLSVAEVSLDDDVSGGDMPSSDSLDEDEGDGG